jgi:hypothetical protein
LNAHECLAAIALTAVCSGPAFADVTQEQELKMSGLMGMMAKGGASKTITRIAGNKMRTDNDDNVQIVDIDSERIYELDVEKKTYRVTTFAEMRQELQEATARANQGTERQAGGRGQDAPEISASADVKVEETGRQESIGGYACRQFLLEFNLNMKDEKSQRQGTMGNLMEVWLTRDAPGTEEANAFHRRMAEKLGTTEIARNLMSGGPANPMMGGIGRMAEEMKKLDGQAMRTVFYIGSVEAARSEALQTGGAAPEGEETEKQRKEGLGGLMEMMRQAGSGSAGGGVLGKMTMETIRLDTQPIDAQVFTVPSDYKQVEGKR